jgi:hypothetical protein
LRKAKDEVTFPPPSWFLSDEETFSNQAEVEATESTGDSVAGEHFEHSEAPEPVSFAQRIKTLIDSLPLPAAFSSAAAPAVRGTEANITNGHDGSAAIPQDDKGPPIPTSVDARLMKLLASEEVMNGDTGPNGKSQGDAGLQRQSVWSALEKMRHSRSAGPADKGGPNIIEEEGVMMYSPLEPASDSQVELAESELEYVDPDDFSSGNTNKEQGKGKERATASPVVPKVPVIEKRWVPSTTNLSLYTTWWGYRLYLPPPVMATLNDNHLKTTKRAAMITAALQWFLNKVPLMMMPPQVRGAIVLLRRLTPLVGYIGVFVAWSWTKIAACNKGELLRSFASETFVDVCSPHHHVGNGVVLTATWLLPVALIPMAWDAGDIHGPSIRPPSRGEQEPEAKGNKAANMKNSQQSGSKLKKPKK